MRQLLLSLVVAAVPCAAQTPAKWRLVPEVTYGAADGSAAELSDVRGIEVAKNGNVLVLDYKAQTVKLFAPDGKFIKNIGRNGGGPGEYATPNGLIRAPDGTMWIHDPDNQRLTVLRDDGSLLKTIQLQVYAFGGLWDGRFDRQGRLVSEVYNPQTRAYKVQRMNYVTGKADTVDRRSCLPPEVAANPGKGGFSFRNKNGGTSFPMPFGPRMLSVAHPAGYMWCSYGSSYTIYRLGIEGGDTLGMIRGNAPVIRVPSASRDSAIARIKKAAAQYGEPNYSPAGVPDVYPFVHGLQLDDRDRLWVQLTPFGAAETRFDVFDATGKPAAKVSAPARLGSTLPVAFRGNQLYALTWDEDGVPSVVRFRIEVVK